MKICLRSFFRVKKRKTFQKKEKEKKSQRTYLILKDIWEKKVSFCLTIHKKKKIKFFVFWKNKQNKLGKKTFVLEGNKEKMKVLLGFFFYCWKILVIK